MRLRGGDIFCLLHGSVLSMSWSAAAAAAAARGLRGWLVKVLSAEHKEKKKTSTAIAGFVIELCVFAFVTVHHNFLKVSCNLCLQSSFCPMLNMYNAQHELKKNVFFIPIDTDY